MATMMKPGTICTFNSHLKELPIFDSSSLRPSLRNSGFNHRNVNLKQARNASLVPVIRAQASPGSCFPISLLLFTKTNSWVLNVFSDLVQNTIWVSLILSLCCLLVDYFPDSKFYKVEAILRCRNYSLFRYSIHMFSF